jgi:hypothetical protein
MANSFDIRRPVDLCVEVNVWRCGAVAIELSRLRTLRFPVVVKSSEKEGSRCVDR